MDQSQQAMLHCRSHAYHNMEQCRQAGRGAEKLRPNLIVSLLP